MFKKLIKLCFLVLIFRISEPPNERCTNVLDICCYPKNAQQQVATTVNTPPGANTSPNTTPSGAVTTIATSAGAVTTPPIAATTSAGAATTLTGAVTTPIVATTPAAAVTTRAPAATTAAGAATTVPPVATTSAPAVTTPTGAVTTPAAAVTTPAAAVTTPAAAVTTPVAAVTTPTAAVTTPPVAVTTPPVATTAPPAVTTLTTPTTTKPPTPTNATQGSTAAPATPTLAPVTPTAAQTTPTTTRMATPVSTPGPTPSTGQCGISFVDTTREPPGESPFVAAFMEFPWMLALLDYRTMSPDGRMMNNAFVCGASLLSKDIAMTAAHCIKGREPWSLIVRAGEWNTMFANESLPHQDRSLSKIILHPEFNNLTLYNDVAILKLDGPVMFANNVQPICLPKAEDKYFGQNCVATGWGQNAFGPNGRYATKLHKVTLPILNQNICEEKFRKTRLGPFFNFHDSFICAGGTENYDTCTGDGGGPLVCKTGNTFTQAGIVSWGIGCGSRDVPGAYVNVPLLKPWIESTMYTLMRDNLPK